MQEFHTAASALNEIAELTANLDAKDKHNITNDILIRNGPLD
jgi:hypothetical protein